MVLQGSTSTAAVPFLVCRSGTRLCAVPLAHVAETMRPLPLEPLADMPPFLLGVSVIRSAVVPVVDLALLTGSPLRTPPGRYVTLRLAGDRLVALAVEGTVGVRALAAESLHEVPPLLRDAAPEVIAAVTLLDAELLLVLQAARVLPESVWSGIAAHEALA